MEPCNFTHCKKALRIAAALLLGLLVFGLMTTPIKATSGSRSLDRCKNDLTIVPVNHSLLVSAPLRHTDTPTFRCFPVTVAFDLLLSPINVTICDVGEKVCQLVRTLTKDRRELNLFDVPPVFRVRWILADAHASPYRTGRFVTF